MNGSSGDENFYGTAVGETIYGGGGGGHFGDSAGIDFLYGGDGDDDFDAFDAVPGDIIDGGSGYDSINVYGDYDLSAAQISNVERIRLFIQPFQPSSSIVLHGSQIGTGGITNVTNSGYGGLTIIGDMVDLTGVTYTNWGQHITWIIGTSGVEQFARRNAQGPFHGRAGR